MTEKLYEKDSLLKTCTATVVSCTPGNDQYLVILDRTVIFPEGGGQLSDEGKINGFPVSFAEEKNGQVVHYCTAAFTPGDKVQVDLNWPVRLDHMQQHCGEHVLSYAFWKTCGANNIGFHMNKELVTIDLDKEVDPEQVQKAELLANEEIWQDKPITVAYMSDTEVASLTMRKKNEKIHGTLRVVSVKDGDICTCCGTHPTSTGMLGLIKVLRWEKHKGGTRIEFNCGKRALENMQQRNSILEETSNLLSVKVVDVLSAVQKLKAEITELHTKNKEKTLALFKAQLPEILATAPVNANGDKLVFVTEECDAKDAKALLQLLSGQDKTRIGLVTRNGERVNYQFALGKGAKGDCKAYCAKANLLFNGRGGGSGSFAQGGGVYTTDWQEKAASLKENIQ